MVGRAPEGSKFRPFAGDSSCNNETQVTKGEQPCFKKSRFGATLPMLPLFGVVCPLTNRFFGGPRSYVKHRRYVRGFGKASCSGFMHSRWGLVDSLLPGTYDFPDFFQCCVGGRGAENVDVLKTVAFHRS